MTDILVFLAGLLLGGIAAWGWTVARMRAIATDDSIDLRTRLAAADATTAEARSQLSTAQATVTELRNAVETERRERAIAQTRLEEAARHVEEQRKLLDDAREKLRETFAAVSTESLKTSGETFLKQTDERVRPLREALERYEKQIKEMESARQTAYGGLREQVTKLATSSDSLNKQTGSLVTALRHPSARGRWGEMTLRRVVDVAGMTERVDFDEQADSTTEAGRQRPDLIVRLPGERVVVVDAKTPLDAYLDAMEFEDADARNAKLVEHARAVRKQVDSLSKKDYAANLKRDSQRTPEFVVMFLPGEAFFSAAVALDPDLIAYAAERQVVLASPTTLIALLRAVAYGWQQQSMAVNAERIAEAGRELFERVCKFTEHLNKIGMGLKKAGEAYNDAAGSWEARVAPSGRLLKELGAAADKDKLPELTPLAQSLRTLPPPDDAG